MDNGISTVRNLLYIVLVLAVLSVCANVYLGTQLTTNSDELHRLSDIMQKQLLSNGLDQSQKLQEKMEKLNQDADGIDAKLQKAQDDFVIRMNHDLPPLIDKTMDNYIKTRAPQIEKQAMKQVPH